MPADEYMSILETEVIKNRCRLLYILDSILTGFGLF